MNDREFGNKIKQELNYSLGQLDAQVAERLKQARERALDAFAVQDVKVSPYAFAGHQGQANHSQAPRRWLPFAMVVIAFVGALYWQQQMGHDEDVDAALLASDIPFNVFTDHDFHSWLDNSTQL